ncbi:MAG: GNAT family N-acetyltransferase [Candidatus Krumholzibacteria bacterium]|nr:GNAT family N-acetyltransferase [Candidatus Krumholzibacteria bacterium]MDH4336988.1 GNAT family N-acetyltransferase [Candidatus Krumholzibacteria bacterium]MDH5270697.1 GNAT family N-acetyltransferase [Candidatus Krumholzibacteria bacterium]MDH5626788.1 GNAT family N-acetyltransferase [Candidatus Krumholzibacteria bacterium]
MVRPRGRRGKGILRGVRKGCSANSGALGLVIRDQHSVFPAGHCAREHRRKGFATEALRCVTKYCSTKCGVTEFMAHIDPENHRSPSLAERLAMRCVGSGPHPVDGAQSDIYSVVVAPRSNRDDS